MTDIYIKKIINSKTGVIYWEMSRVYFTGKGTISMLNPCKLFWVFRAGLDWTIKITVHQFCRVSFEAGFNSLCHSDATWWHKSKSTLLQVMDCCLKAPSHYLNQYWLLMKYCGIHLKTITVTPNKNTRPDGPRNRDLGAHTINSLI